MLHRKIYVIWDHPLFYESMRLLLNHPHIEMVGANSDYVTAHEEILTLRPDILLIEDVSEDERTQIMNVFESCPWTMLILLISMDDNQLNMYHHERRTVVNTDDLLNWVLKK